MNYVITTPDEGFIIGLIFGAIVYGIFYNVFIENNKSKNEGGDKEPSTSDEIKTESTSTNLLNDSFRGENIRDHILSRPKEEEESFLKETDFSNSISNPELFTEEKN